ncbi:MAG: fatty acid desaturase family protein [Pseudobdellovibrio sp.]
MSVEDIQNTSGMNTETFTEIPSETPAASNQEPVKNLAYYNRKITAVLPAHFFERTPLRIAYAGLFFGLNVLLVLAVLKLDLHWSLKILAGVLIGQFNAGMAFISHETSHGQHIASKNAQDALVLFAFSPFMISPTYWRFWHNRLHHGNTQYILKDPDAFPNMTVYRQSKFMQRLFAWTPGSGTIRSYFYFFFWFSFQSFLNQIYMRFGNKMWEEMKHNRVSVEFGFQILLVATYIYFVGSQAPIYLILIPFAVQNYTVMSYISTNHNISPLTKINDPLENSLTVTTNPLLDLMHLNFGYHVEHHIFPRMSGAYTKNVHYALKKMFPETYQYMKKSDALKLLYSTPRIYKNHTTLIHPETLERFHTLPNVHKIEF